MCQALPQKQKVLHIPHDIYLMRWDKIHLNLKLEQWVTMKKMVDLLDSLEVANDLRKATRIFCLATWLRAEFRQAEWYFVRGLLHGSSRSVPKKSMLKS
uniref:Uncharacterized protein n=1 Tax=Ditylenchus dipsaci TaxID=166011 RepID=A0A915DP60_9BILA